MDVNFRDKDGLTTLMHAAKSGNIDLLKFVLGQGASTDLISHDEQTALMFATMECNEDIVDILIHNKANLNIQDKFGKTALMHVCGRQPSREKKEIIQMLVKNGAKTNLQDSNGYTALIHATVSEDIYNKLYTETLKILINSENVNIKDNQGICPLRHAFTTNKEVCFWREKHYNIAEFFIENGADVNAKDNNGTTILMWSVGYENIFDGFYGFLIENGADINAKDDNGKTTLMHAIGLESEDTVLCLVELGANIDAKDNSGKTVLMYASNCKEFCINSDDYDIYSEIVNKSTSINDRDNNGMTALMYAVKSRHNNKVMQLLNIGAEVNIENNDGKTALIFESEINKSLFFDKTIAFYLLEFGANISNNISSWIEKLFIDSFGNSKIYQAIINKNQNQLHEIFDEDGYDLNVFMPEFEDQQDLKEYFQCQDRSSIMKKMFISEIKIASWLAVVLGNKEGIDFILDYYSKNINKLLQTSIFARRYNVLEFLLEKKANPYIKLKNNVNCFHVAAARGDVRALRILGNYHKEKTKKNIQAALNISECSMFKEKKRNYENEITMPNKKHKLTQTY